MTDRLPIMCDDPAAFRDEQVRRKSAEARVEDLEAENEKLRANLADLVTERDELGKALYEARQRIERADAELAKVDAQPAPVVSFMWGRDTDDRWWLVRCIDGQPRARYHPSVGELSCFRDTFVQWHAFEWRPDKLDAQLAPAVPLEGPPYRCASADCPGLSFAPSRETPHTDCGKRGNDEVRHGVAAPVDPPVGGSWWRWGSMRVGTRGSDFRIEVDGVERYVIKGRELRLYSAHPETGSIEQRAVADAWLTHAPASPPAAPDIRCAQLLAVGSVLCGDDKGEANDHPRWTPTLDQARALVRELAEARAALGAPAVPRAAPAPSEPTEADAPPWIERFDVNDDGEQLYIPTPTFWADVTMRRHTDSEPCGTLAQWKAWRERLLAHLDRVAAMPSTEEAHKELLAAGLDRDEVGRRGAALARAHLDQRQAPGARERYAKGIDVDGGDS